MNDPITTESLAETLRLHALWLKSEGGKRANLSDANLSGANLRGAGLGYANLRYAGLRGANLRYAGLRGANLRGANLRGANLGGANLNDANLRGANLRGANLNDVNLRGANLSDANLNGANLRGANLGGANLGSAAILLPVNDPRGYVALALWDGVEWIIQSGCRAFTVTDARTHWGADNYFDKARAARYLMALDWLEEWGDAIREG